jgi:hypothetical protein
MIIRFLFWILNKRRYDMKFQDVTKDITVVEKRRGRDLNKSQVDAPISMFLDYCASKSLEDTVVFMIREHKKRQGKWAKKKSK